MRGEVGHLWREVQHHVPCSSESYVAGAHCVLSRHGGRFAWVGKREKIVRLLQSSLKGCEGRSAPILHQMVVYSNPV